MAESDLKDLMSRIEAEARKEGLSLDLPIYEAAGRDPHVPILFAGNLNAGIAVIGRDLGAQEVRFGEPLIGGAGHRVREAVYQAVTGQGAAATDRHLPVAMECVLLTNTVPYKPVGNKAYPGSVKERFRPFLEELLVRQWRGNYAITLGTEAFKWFAKYANRSAADVFWQRPDRYEAEFVVSVTHEHGGEIETKQVAVAPLPHPSPLNQTYWPVFPELLRKRLTRTPNR